MILDISFKGVSQAAFLLLTSTSVAAQYTLQDDYSLASFASMVDFFTDNDPTAGYVNYVSQSQAQSQGLSYSDNGTIYLGVDSTNAASGRGRDSVRVSTRKSYSHGLIILDLAHMPAVQCGTWPAFWIINSLKVYQDIVEENYPSLATSASPATSSVTPWITKTLDASMTLSTVVASLSTTSYDIPSSTSEPTSTATAYIPTTYPSSSARTTQSAKDRTGSWWK